MLEFRPDCCSDHEPASLLPLTDTDTPSAPPPHSQRYSAVRHVNLSPTDFIQPPRFLTEGGEFGGLDTPTGHLWLPVTAHLLPHPFPACCGIRESLDLDFYPNCPPWQCHVGPIPLQNPCHVVCLSLHGIKTLQINLLPPKIYLIVSLQPRTETFHAGTYIPSAHPNRPHGRELQV